MSLGLSIGKRKILNGARFDGLFPSESEVYSNDRVLKNGDVYDTVKLMCQIIKKDAGDTVKIAKELKAPTREQTLQNIHSFMVNYLQYDTEAGEKLRRPARTWHVGNKEHDKKTYNVGVDCDDMAIFSGSILYNLGIPYFIRIVKIKNDDFQHVYLVVPKSGNTLNPEDSKTYYTLDGVISDFNYEHPFKVQNTFNSEGMQIQYLGGLGAADVTPEAVYQFLVKLKEAIKAKSSLINESGLIQSETALKYIDNVLTNWNNPTLRNKILLQLSQVEQLRTPKFRLFTRLAHLLKLNPPLYQTDTDILRAYARKIASQSKGVGQVGDWIDDLAEELYQNTVKDQATELATLEKELQNTTTSTSWFNQGWTWLQDPQNISTVQQLYNLFAPGNATTTPTTTTVPPVPNTQQNNTPASSSIGTTTWLLIGGLVLVGGGILYFANSSPKKAKA